MIKLSRPIAVLGGMRIPFCRNNTNYMRLGNLEMLSAAIKSLVDKFNLKGEILGDAAAGAVMKHSRDWSMTREAVLSSGLHPHTPAHNLGPCLRHFHCPPPSNWARVSRWVNWIPPSPPAWIPPATCPSYSAVTSSRCCWT